MNFRRSKVQGFFTYIIMIAFLFTLMPTGVVGADEGEMKINEIGIYADYDNAIPPNPRGGTITIFGENLQGKGVQLWDSTLQEPDGGQKGYVNVGQGFGKISTSEYMIQVTLTGTEFAAVRLSQGIIVAGKKIVIDTEPGNINNIDPKIIELGTQEKIVTLSGEGLDAGELIVEGLIKNVEYEVSGSGQELELKIKSGASAGLKSIVLSRVQAATPDRPKITFERYYANQIRILREWKVLELEMYPNAGVRNQTIVTFEANNLENSSVFFVKDEKDKFELKNLATHEYWNGDEKRLKVKLPDLEPGTYRVVLTNIITNPKAGEDLRNKISRQHVVDGVFYIMSATDAPSIYSIEPNEGPNEIENEVTITARRLEEVDKISGLTLVNPNPYSDEDDLVGNGKKFTGNLKLEDNNKGLIIEYGKGTYNIGTLDITGYVYSEITVVVGERAKFQTIEEQHLTKNYDVLKMNFPEVDIDTYGAVHDVEISIATHLITDDENKKYTILTQEIIKEKGFTYKPSTIIPDIKEVIPDSIQVVEIGGNFTTKHDLVLAIKGNKFIVNRFTEAGKEVILYPRIKLGDSLIINREDNEVTIRDANNNSTKHPGIRYEIFKGNALVTGILNNDTGDKIIIHIPAGTIVNPGDVSEDKRDIAITNYKPRSRELALAGIGQKLIKFYETNKWNPIIDKINPHVVSANEGKKGVEITGSGFWQDVEVYIGGNKLDKVERVNENLIIIDVPPARVGETVLTVQNIHPEGGGQDSKPFLYVATKDNPKISGIAPQEGTVDSQIIISGINFFPPDPSSDKSGDMLDRNRLIGSKVLFNGRDINQYNEEGQNIKFEPYFAPANNPLLKIDDEGNLALSDYYQSVYLSDSGSYYKLVPLDYKRVKLTNIENNEYILTIKDGALLAYNKYGADKGGVTVNADGLTVDGMNLKMETPYVQAGGKIIGHKVRFIDNESKILVTIPDLGNPGYYDVTVRNPDMMEDTWKDGFYFNKGMTVKPTIGKIEPPQGSVAGGYTIVIHGEGFEDSASQDGKTKVWINSIPAEVVGINALRTQIEVKVPPYNGDLKEELEKLGITIPRKSVPIAVANPSTGASFLVEDAFAYVIPNSKPVIKELSKKESNAAGGDYVQVNGLDFRYYEPFFTANKPDNNSVAGRDYIDINGDNAWTNLAAIRDLDSLTEKDKKILPEIFFGTKKAAIVDYGENYIGVKIPANNSGAVDVYLVNNDSGISNKVKFTYTSSNPTLNKIIPETGNRAGNDIVDIHGKDFTASKINILNPKGEKTEANLMLVRFGDINNYENNEIFENSKIIGGVVNNLEIEGNLKVSYNANAKNISLEIKQENIVYSRVFDNYDDSPVFINLQELVDEAGNKWKSYELIKFEVIRDVSNRIIIERGYAPTVRVENSGHLVVNTPSYHTAAKVPVIIINPDKGRATGQFDYKNPDSRPQITNITRDTRGPVNTFVEGKKIRLLKVNYQANSRIVITGIDFREGAKVQIGSIFAIEPKDITEELPIRLSFDMPDVAESALDTLHKVVVTNKDGASANSGLLDPPIMLQFTKGETEPKITKVSPLLGPASGGTLVRIEGEDFRAAMDGYEGEVPQVNFGENPASQIEIIDYKTIQAVTPINAPGSLSIRVENPDGENTKEDIKFEYISTPKITALINATDPTETIRINQISAEGGQEIKIKGTGFIDGAKVIFMPKVKDKGKNDENAAGANSFYWVGTKEEEFSGRKFISNIVADHILESGTDASEVKFVDEETLTVKVPPGKLDGKGIIVINPDKGASNIYDDITYGLPELDAPLGVTAEIMHDKYNKTDTGIKVNWNEVKGASEYEIYVVKNGQMDFIGSTKLLAYIHEDLEARTTYKFIVTAVGDFGSSKPSAESNEVRTGREVGVPDRDGGVVENTKQEKKGNTALVNIGTTENRSNIILDLTRGELAGAKELILSIPAQVVNSKRYMNIDIKGSDFVIKLTPGAFYNNQVSQYANKKDAGVRFTVKALNTSTTSSPNGLSAVYELKADFYNEKTTSPYDYLAANMSIVLDYDVRKANLRNFRNVSISRHDPYSSNWQALGKDTYLSGATSSSINRLGNYGVIGGRN